MPTEWWEYSKTLDCNSTTVVPMSAGRVYKNIHLLEHCYHTKHYVNTCFRPCTCQCANFNTLSDISTGLAFARIVKEVGVWSRELVDITCAFTRMFRNKSRLRKISQNFHGKKPHSQVTTHMISRSLSQTLCFPLFLDLVTLTCSKLHTTFKQGVYKIFYNLFKSEILWNPFKTHSHKSYLLIFHLPKLTGRILNTCEREVV